MTPAYVAYGAEEQYGGPSLAGDAHAGAYAGGTGGYGGQGTAGAYGTGATSQYGGGGDEFTPYGGDGHGPTSYGPGGVAHDAGGHGGMAYGGDGRSAASPRAIPQVVDRRRPGRATARPGPTSARVPASRPT